jgi:tRNA(Ile)-lysidine synthase TilS/MesJ
MSGAEAVQTRGKAPKRMTKERALELLGRPLSKIDEGELREVLTKESTKWAEKVCKKGEPTPSRSIKKLIVSVDSGGFDLA